MIHGRLAYVPIYVHIKASETKMDVLSFTDARANLKSVMDKVVRDRTQVVVTRQKAEAVVIVSLEDWNSIEETLHLLSSPRNAERLRRSVAQLNEGKGSVRELQQP
jgi:antitoxin YefM